MNIIEEQESAMPFISSVAVTKTGGPRFSGFGPVAILAVLLVLYTTASYLYHQHEEFFNGLLLTMFNN